MHSSRTGDCLMKNLINFFRAMGEETRAKIIMMLLREEMCICELIDELGLSQSAVSHHVKILKQTDLVNMRRCGKWTYYSINKSGFEAHLRDLQEKLGQPLEHYSYVQKRELRAKCAG